MTRHRIPDPHYGWPGGPTADDDPTPAESALAALKYGAMLAGALTIVLMYLGAFGGVGLRRDLASALVLAAFLLPSLAAFLRTRWVRRRRRRDPGPDPLD